MEIKRLSEKEFFYIYHKVPRAGVDIVIRNSDGVLLAKRTISPFKGQWCLPGGTILFREPVEQAVCRIAQNELGVKIKIVKHLGIIDYLRDGYKHTVSNAFLAKVESGNPQSREQAEEVKFFTTLPPKTHKLQKEFLLKNWKNIFN